MRSFKKGTINVSKIIMLGFALIVLAVGAYLGPLVVPSKNKETGLKEIPADTALANYRYIPTGGSIITGTAQTITSQTAALAEGVNTGSYKATLGLDNFHWQVASTASGINVEETLGGAALNGANTIILETTFDLDATVPSTVVQICDFVSSTSVDNAASGGCTTGGWRTVNNNKTAITATTTTGYSWHIYDGYWSNGSNTSISTPLSNFLSSNQLLIRFYSTTNTTSVLSIDMVRAFVVVHPLYYAGGFTNLGSGTPTGDYTQTFTNTADSVFLAVPGTAGSISDFYLSYKNVKTYSGMNSIAVRTQYVCSATGISIRPKIYNFNSSAWEDMTSAAIACPGAASNSQFAKTNITIANYISSGEIRIGWYGSANSTIAIRIDYQYVVLGTVNTDTSKCTVTYGTVSSGTCANVYDLDTTAATSVWTIAAEDESSAVAHDFYPGDCDGDATIEECSAVHIKFPNIIRPNNGYVIGAIAWARYQPNTVSGSTISVSLRDYGNIALNTGVNASDRGGFIQHNSTAGTSYALSDRVLFTGATSAAVNSGSLGLIAPGASLIDTVNGQMEMAFQTSADGAAANNSSFLLDFAMVSLVWTEDSTSITETFAFTPTADNFVTGTHPSNSSATAAAAEGVEAGGGWQALLMDDNFHMGIVSTTSGYNAQITLGGAQLNGATNMLIQTEIDEDATAPATLIQICDFVSSTSVDAAASGDCSTGGWRTINNRKATLAPTTGTQYSFEVYNGYWTNGSNTALSTPLSNFISGSNNIVIRYYSTTNTTTTVNVDFLRVVLSIAPHYYPAGFTNLGSGSPTGDYSAINAVPAGASDNNYLTVPGTAGSIADFYHSFKNVKTYTGMNSLLFRAEYACTTTGINIRPKIYNFNSSSWENLGAAAIACSATDAITEYSLNNVTLSNYISSGEIRIGWYGSANSTVGIKLDTEYIILGTTNTASAGTDCFISFGTLSAGDCTNTRGIVTMGAGADSVWKLAAEDESAAFGHDYYPFDIDNDATASEEGTAAQADFSITKNTNTLLTSFFYAGRYKAGTAGTMLLSVLDTSGVNAASSAKGGFFDLSTGATTSLIYSDNITLSTITGIQGQMYGVDDILDTVNNRVFMRFRTSVDGGSATNSLPFWDFAMASIGWIEVAPKYTISGSIYQSGSQSTLDTTAYTVAVSVNNGTPYTATASAGTYSVPNVPLTAGDQIAVYIQGNANDANSISEVSAADQTVNLYVGRTAVYHTYTDSTSNSEVCSQSTYPASGDNLFTCATSVPTYSSGGLLVAGAYTPGGNVNATVAEIMSAGTYTGGSETLTLTNSGTGASRPFIQGGTFTPSTNTVAFTGTSATEITSTTYNNLQVYPASGTQTYTLGTAVSQAVVVNGNLQVGNGGTTTFDFDTYDPTLTIKGGLTLSSLAIWTKSHSSTLTFSPVGTQTITDNNSTKSDLGPVVLSGGTSTPKINMGSSLKMSTLTIAASHEFSANGSNTLTLIETSGTLLTNSGTFAASTGTVEYTPDASVTLTSGTLTFNNLTLDPTITSTGKTYTFGSGALAINGDMTINPTAASALALTVNMGADITASATSTITITRTTSATSNLSTTGSNYALTTGKLNIATGGTLTANASTITLTATSSTLFTLTGTFTYGTSTVVFNPDASVTLTSGTISFYNLSLTPTITSTGKTYTFGSGTLTVNNNFTSNPTASSSLALTVNLGAATTVTGTTSITGTTSGTSNLSTTGTNYALTSGLINIGSAGTLTANGSTVTLTGTSGTLFTRSGTFTAGTSTVIFNPDAAVTLTSGTVTFNNVSMTPTLTTNRTYTFGSGAITINGDMTLNPSAPSPMNFFVNMGATITASATSTITITRTSSATSILDTTSGGNYALTTGKINVATAGNVYFNASTITLTGTSSTLFTNNGTVNYGTSTVVMNPDASVTLTSGTVPFYNLSLTPTITSTGKTYTFGTSFVAVHGDMTIDPTASSALALTVNLQSTLAVDTAKTLTITSHSSATSVLDAQGNTIYSGRFEIRSGGTFTAGAYLYLTGYTAPLFSNAGTFTYGTGTVSFIVDSSYYVGTPLTSGVGDYYNLDMSPTIGGDAYYYLSALASVNVHNNFTISPNASSAYTLAVSTGVPMAVSGTTDIAASGSAMALLTTTSSNYTFATNSLSIHSGATFNANAAIVYIGGTGTPVLNSGTHNSSSGLYHYAGDDNVLIDDTPYYELWLEPVQSVDRIYDVVVPNANLVVTHLFSISPRGTGSSTLSFVHDGDISGGGDVNINQWATGDLAQLKPPSPHAYTLGILHMYDKGLADLGPLSSLSLGGVIIDDSPAAQLTAPNSITMYNSGDFYLYDRGVFLHSNGTVEFNGTGIQTVYGVNGNLDTYPFYNITVTNTAGRVLFTNYTSMTVSNLFTIPAVDASMSFQDGAVFQVQDIDWQGGSSAYAHLDSLNPGTQWQLKQIGAQYNVRYIDATDSDASPANTINATDPTNHDGGNNINWNFPSATLTMSLSANSVNFGTFSSSAARFANTSSGSTTEIEAHALDVSTSAASGYTVTVEGLSPTNGVMDITSIGASSSGSIPGTKQFGMRLQLSSGGGSVATEFGYSSRYAFDDHAINTIATSSVPDASTYSIRYVGNISPTTAPGNYHTTLTYVVTGSF